MNTLLILLVLLAFFLIFVGTVAICLANGNKAMLLAGLFVFSLGVGIAYGLDIQCEGYKIFLKCGSGE